MEYNKVNASHITKFKGICGEQFVLCDIDSFNKYGKDETEDIVKHPEVVLKPTNTNQISEIVKYCFEQNIPITPRGAGTGLSGGAIPAYGGVCMSTENLNRILKIDEENFQVTTEPGVITQVLQEAVAEKKMYYPPDPASRGSCFIGGNIAENSGGPRAVKYGVVKDYVLNLEMVLPNGEIMWTGANVLKNATGYNLTQLIVGSEGTLGIVTKIVLKLIPLPTKNKLMLVPFTSAEKACEAVAAIFKKGVTPSGLEFMERDALEWTINHIGDETIKLDDNVQAHLLIEVDGNHDELLMQDCEQIMEVCEDYDCLDILFAENEQEKETLWKLRRRVGEAVKANSIYKEEDTVVPRAELPRLLRGVKQIGNKFGFKSVCYGHAGDGNLHVNIVKGDMSDDAWNNELSKGIREIFELCKSLGGTISGEHGIGLVQKNYMDIVFNETQLTLMRQIKEVFDPKGIMNPGKIFADN